MDELNLTAIPRIAHDTARQFYESGDYSFIRLNGGGAALAIVLDNIEPLKRIGKYEEALVSAYKAPKTNFHTWSQTVIDYLFAKADREMLRSLGSPIPTEKIQVYRGISGHGCFRRKSGWSWTSSLEIACWFATRYDLANPAILSAINAPEEILHHTNDRGEQEYIVKPRKSRRFAISIDEIEKNARRHQQGREVETKKRLEEFRAKMGSRVVKGPAL
jgi:hypothetical protein